MIYHYVNNVVNSIVIPTITTLEVRNIISSTKKSSPEWDDIPALIAKKCIEYYIDQLTYIIKEGVFPSELKLARVVPLVKSGDSIQITKYYSSLYNYQFGFRHRYSTQQAIITLIGKTYVFIGWWWSGDLVIGVLLLILLITKYYWKNLFSYCIRGNILKWYESNLTDRYQYVAHNGQISSLSFAEYHRDLYLVLCYLLSTWMTYAMCVIFAQYYMWW